MITASKNLKLIFIIYACVSFVSCKKNMKYLDSKFYPEKNIYFVRYANEGGFLEKNKTYYYVTDSVNFTKYLGSTDNNELYKITVDKNQFIFMKYSKINGDAKTPILLSEYTYDIAKLKEEGIFDK